MGRDDGTVNGMRVRRERAAVLAAALLLLPTLAAAAGAPQASGDASLALAQLPGPGGDPASFVDPMIGTALGGFVFPGPAMPFGMVQLSPDTDGPAAYTGYQWLDASIRGFSHVHIESMGVRMGGNLPFMPVTGPLPPAHPDLYKSPFTHAAEHAEAGYYRVLLPRHATTVELTAGERVGMHRYTFPEHAEANLLVHAGHSVPGPHRAALEILDLATVAGTAWPQAGYEVHFVARFDPPALGFGGWDEQGMQPQPSRGAVDGTGAGLYLRWDTGRMEEPVVRVKVGISFVSRANAQANLEAEAPGPTIRDADFEALRARNRAAWSEVLGRVQVEGPGLAARRSLYTALYHVMHHPNVFHDVNGAYAGHDGRVHVLDPGHDAHYANFGLWDTLRGQMQLLAVLQPDRYRDMLHSLRVIGEQDGRLPRWALMDTTPDYMIGEPALPVLADGLCRGLAAPADVAPLYDAMRATAFDPARRREASYLAHGYVPHDVTDRGASATLEHAMADFGLALTAQALGHEQDAQRAAAMAGNWRNLLDPESRFLRPRLSDGSWMTPFMAELPFGYVEGTGWQWSWLAPHDARGLFDGMGQDRGGDAFVRDRLDTFFALPLSAALPGMAPHAQAAASGWGLGYAGNQYAPSNEHDLHAPYLYNALGEPWKTQAVVRGLQALYRPTPDGLPGNDDTGTLSAWFAWSALGLYPGIPGAPLLVIGSPRFEAMRVWVRDAATGEEGWFAVRAPGAPLHRYVQSASLDGAPLERTWLRHDEVRPGSTLVLDLGPLPNPVWGTGPGAAPPSLGRDGLEAFGCG